MGENVNLMCKLANFSIVARKDGGPNSFSGHRMGEGKNEEGMEEGGEGGEKSKYPFCAA